MTGGDPRRRERVLREPENRSPRALLGGDAVGPDETMPAGCWFERHQPKPVPVRAAVVVVTHDREVARNGDREMRMADGRVVSEEAS